MIKGYEGSKQRLDASAQTMLVAAASDAINLSSLQQAMARMSPAKQEAIKEASGVPEMSEGLQLEVDKLAERIAAAGKAPEDGRNTPSADAQSAIGGPDPSVDRAPPTPPTTESNQPSEEVVDVASQSGSISNPEATPEEVVATQSEDEEQGKKRV